MDVVFRVWKNKTKQGLFCVLCTSLYESSLIVATGLRNHFRYACMLFWTHVFFGVFTVVLMLEVDNDMQCIESLDQTGLSTQNEH